jgi:hypothetical protein
MKSKIALCRLAIAVVLQLGILAGSAQTNLYLFSGSETNITLPPGTYIITAYGAAGGWAANETGYVLGGLGAEMSAEFNFSTSTNLTLLVGGYGGYGSYEYQGNGGGGGGGSFVVAGSTPLVVAGGGGGAAAYGGAYASGGKGIITTDASSGGGNAGGSGGTGGTGGIGAYYYAGLQGGAYGVDGGGAGGGGGFYTDGGIGNYLFYNEALGGSSFEDGGAGGISNFGIGGVAGYLSGDGGFGGGGGGFTSENFACGGGGGGYSGGGGGGAEPTNDILGAGGGGGSFIDSSAIAILAEVSGINGGRHGGEIMITAVSTPIIITTGAAFGFTNGVFGFNVIGPSGSNVVIQASTDLQTWIPLQTNLLGSVLLYFSDPQSPTNIQRFYRAQLLP